MTGAFSDIDPERCLHYATFMQHLKRKQADAVFWSLFCVVIVLLVTASQMYTKASKTPRERHQSEGDLEKCLSEADNVLLHRKTRKNCLLVSLTCFILALVCVIFEIFALFAIQFCDGEDLMPLFYGFWTLIQVGSLIAILGISLNQWYALNDNEQPPWNVALGTPVLVIAAGGHAIDVVRKQVWNKYVRKVSTTSTPDGVAMSRASTISIPPSAIHVGHTMDGQALFAIPTSEVASSGLLLEPSVSSSTKPLRNGVDVSDDNRVGRSPRRSIRFASDAGSPHGTSVSPHDRSQRHGSLG